jgi:hypothetical protein
MSRRWRKRLRELGPMWGVHVLFIGAIVAAGLLGEMAARFFPEPLIQLIRERWRGGKMSPAPSALDRACG